MLRRKFSSCVSSRSYQCSISVHNSRKTPFSHLLRCSYHVTGLNDLNSLRHDRNEYLPEHHVRWKSTVSNNASTVSSSKEKSTTTPKYEDLSIEEQYSRKSQLEHILLRPQMYVGPVEKLEAYPHWLFVEDPSQKVISNGNQTKELPLDKYQYQVKCETVGVFPALNKIFDEILVNAYDNRLRHIKSGKTTRIDVTIDPGGGNRRPFISVFNDGRGIPVQVHKEEKMYVPEMLFGNLLTGSNFDDGQKRVTGGRHGFGAKLANIFSNEFVVETADTRKKLRYRQQWTNNMKSSAEPVISDLKKGETDYTCVSFVPDLAKLTGNPNATSIPPEDYAIMCRRVLDIAGCSGGGLTVTLNGRDVSMGGFEEYSQLYRSDQCPPLLYAKINNRWEVGIGLSNKGYLESISFVNGVATAKGGTHVNAIVQQITKAISDEIGKQEPDIASNVKPAHIRQNLFVSINTLIENPAFDSQMKERLTSVPATFGTSYDLSHKVLRAILKAEGKGGPGIIEEVVRAAKSRQQAALFRRGGKKTKRQVLSIPKLEDAYNAGKDVHTSKKACTLILTEGDSAKALAVAGLEIIGREYYGVFPLRGKFLNVRHAAPKKLKDNAEVNALCTILGLDFERDYKTENERHSLRYRQVMLMTDQDNDGAHIKGLVLNFFRYFWPNLLLPPIDNPTAQPFLSSFVTPLLKVKKKGRKESLSFFSMNEYNDWRSSLRDSDEIKKWDVKYYKGLGTSTPTEAKDYFKAFTSHYRPFRWNSDADGEQLDMAFVKERASDRRDWMLQRFDEYSNISVNPEEDYSVTFEDFVNKELIQFSNADNARSIPSVIDGLKPSQRKVLYACFKRKLKSEIKVAQLAGYCAEHTAYHHGEVSLHSTIIGMAQDYVGSNNINLLEPSGQFGTRLIGGKDAASPRYIFTRLSPIARYLFPEADDVLLNYKEDDGQLIEPDFYCPVIPLLLINGSEGIGTGWSTFIPPHSPHDVLSYIRAKLDKLEELPSILPWARGFQGDIEVDTDGNSHISIGKITPLTKSSLSITELPIGVWTEPYKKRLLKMCENGDIKSFVENHTTTSVSFTVHATEKKLESLMEDDFHKSFKLKSSLQHTNMNAFNTSNTIQKFDSAQSIAEAFFPTRLALYIDRKSVLESELNYEATKLRTKAEFISAVNHERLDLIGGKKSKEETVANLHELGFLKMSDLKALKNDNAMAKRRREALNVEIEDDEKDYDYLLNMPMSSLTADKIQDLHAEASKTEKKLSDLRKSTPEDLWRADLEALQPYLDESEKK